MPLGDLEKELCSATTVLSRSATLSTLRVRVNEYEYRYAEHEWQSPQPAICDVYFLLASGHSGDGHNCMSLSSISQTALSGIWASEAMLGVAADNLANLETPGFKQSQVRLTTGPASARLARRSVRVCRCRRSPQTPLRALWSRATSR